MKTASYLSMLIRMHVRAAPVMPPAELDELKVLAAQLAAMGRRLRTVDAGVRATPVQGDVWGDLLTEVRSVVESLRDTVAAVVRANLISWEAGDA